jgi:hypothetical protein
LSRNYEEGERRLVLSEEAAVEVLAYLITAARTQLDEAAEYAPLRLLGAARKLAEHLSASASAPVRDLLSSLESLPITAAPSADPEAYAARLDRTCVAVAHCLLALDEPETERE